MDPTFREVADSMKLDGQSNYILWSYKVKMMLMQENLWRFIVPAVEVPSSSGSTSADSGTATSPTAPPIPTIHDTLAAVPAQHDVAEKKIRACRIIVAMVKDPIILHIIHLTDPLEIWNKLKTMYDVQSPSRRLALKEKLYSLRMLEGKTLDSHLQEVNSIVTQLASLGVVIQDEDLVDLMLSSLPKSWSTFKIIQQSRDRSPTFSELQGLMLREESSRILEKHQESEEVLYLNRPNPRSHHSRDNQPGRFGRAARGRGRGGFPTNSRICKRCGQSGHSEGECEVLRIQKQIRDLQIQLSRLKTKPETSYSTIHEGLSDEDFDGAEDTQAALNACMSAFTTDEDPWFLDSGASSHVTGNSNLISDISDSSISSIRTAAGQVLPVSYKGNVQFTDPEVKTINDILYVPGVKTNLLSVGRFTDLGHTIIFDSHACTIFDVSHPEEIYLQAIRDPRTRLYRLSAKPIVKQQTILSVTHKHPVSVDTIDLWHRRLAHINFQSLYHMTHRNLVNGVPSIPYLKRPCSNCVMGKLHRESFPKLRTTFTTLPLQLIHSDLCGPLSTPTRHNCKYILTFIDDFSRKTWLYFLVTKSQTLSYFIKFKSLVESPLLKIQALRSDRGGEYLSDEFQQFCSSHGIHHQLTAGYSPQQNGIAERKNRHLLEGIRSVASGTQIPRFLWDEIAKSVNYIQNRLPCRALNRKTPEEAFTGTKPNLAHLRVLGCLAYCHIPKEKRNKLDPKALPTILLGYDEQSKAYRC